jgi:hypothetical protein
VHVRVQKTRIEAHGHGRCVVKHYSGEKVKHISLAEMKLKLVGSRQHLRSQCAGGQLPFIGPSRRHIVSLQPSFSRYELTTHFRLFSRPLEVVKGSRVTWSSRCSCAARRWRWRNRVEGRSECLASRLRQSHEPRARMKVVGRRVRHWWVQGRSYKKR